MKNYIFILLIALFSCDILDDIKSDPCDATILKGTDQFNVSSSRVYGEVNLVSTTFAATAIQYRYTYTKLRCGGGATQYYSSGVTTKSTKNLLKIQFEHVVSCATQLRNQKDEILVEFTCHELDSNGDIIRSEIATDKFTYWDLDHAVHNGNAIIVPFFAITF